MRSYEKATVAVCLEARFPINDQSKYAVTGTNGFYLGLLALRVTAQLFGCFVLLGAKPYRLGGEVLYWRRGLKECARPVWEYSISAWLLLQYSTAQPKFNENQNKMEIKWK